MTQLKMLFYYSAGDHLILLIDSFKFGRIGIYLINFHDIIFADNQHSKPSEKYDIYPSGKPWAFSSQIIIYILTVIKHTQLSYNQISQVVLLD